MISKAALLGVQWWADRLQQGDKEAFKTALAPLIQADIDEFGRCKLECDYDPFDHLLTAIRSIGIECNGCMYSAEGILPMKHLLWVMPDLLEPKEGYGNWTETIKVEQ